MASRDLPPDVQEASNQSWRKMESAKKLEV